jgi:thioredoxin 2
MGSAAAREIRCEHCGRTNRVPVASAGRPRCGNCQRPLPWIADAGDHDFAEIAEQSTLPVVLDLWAPWCGPCHMVSPALEQLAKEFAGTVKLVKVDIERAPDLAARFAVRAVPTLLVLYHGEVLDRVSGAVPLPMLRDWVTKNVDSVEKVTPTTSH